MVAFNYRCEEQKQQHEKLCFSVKTHTQKNTQPPRSHKVPCQSGHQIKAKKAVTFFLLQFLFSIYRHFGTHSLFYFSCYSPLFVFQRTASSKEISNEEETQVFQIYYTLFFLLFPFIFLSVVFRNYVCERVAKERMKNHTGKQAENLLINSRHFNVYNFNYKYDFFVTYFIILFNIFHYFNYFFTSLCFFMFSFFCS